MPCRLCGLAAGGTRPSDRQRPGDPHRHPPARCQWHRAWGWVAEFAEEFGISVSYDQLFWVSAGGQGSGWLISSASSSGRLLGLSNPAARWFDRPLALARLHHPVAALGVLFGSGEPVSLALARGSLAASWNGRVEGRRDCGAQWRASSAPVRA